VIEVDSLHRGTFGTDRTIAAKSQQ
jgi:hypothetical protein